MALGHERLTTQSDVEYPSGEDFRSPIGLEAGLEQIYYREEEYVAMHKFFWRKARQDDPDAVLVEGLDKRFGQFEPHPGSWKAAEALARNSISNLDRSSGHSNPLLEVCNRNVRRLGLMKLLDEASVVIATNHQSLFNPGEIIYGISVAFKEIYNYDIRPKTYMLIGPTISTSMFRMPAGVEDIYMPSQINTYCNWILTVPDTKTSRVSQAPRLTREINLNAAKIVRDLKAEPGNIIIVAPSGRRDTKHGIYAETPSAGSYKLVSPSKTCVVIPVAVADRGIEAGAKKGSPVPVGIAFGNVYHSTGLDTKNLELAKHIVDTTLYGQLVPQAVRFR
ncbi:MAG TPA: hypothetical protein VGA08_00830 [Candidatus Saccharimonadales bacterium]